MTEGHSKYLAVSRAVKGDDIWCDRVRTACAIEGLECDERALILITHACAAHIQVDADQMVTTTQVTDTEIRDAIISLMPDDQATEEGESS